MDQADISWPRDALPRGTELNGYRIEAVIGRGGFGITYRATDAIDQIFAVKECFPKQFAVRQGNEVYPSDQDSAEPFAECLTRFGGEARALRQLAAIGAAGDGVVKVTTFFPANGTAYVIMEFLDGDSLDRVIKSQQSGLPQAQLDFIVPRLLHATACVHRAGLLHRDIKPANIILRADGRPVLIDFGAARASSQGRTITFTQIFSEGYAPIEQFAGTRQGPFSDVYALGATLYRAIGGTAVDSFTRHQAILRGKRDPQPPAAQIGSGRYDTRLLSAIDAALVVSPEERPQTIAALLALLNETPDSDPTVITPRAAATPEPNEASPPPVGWVSEAPPITRRPSVAASTDRPEAGKPKSRARLAIGILAGLAVSLAAGLAIYHEVAAPHGAAPAATNAPENPPEPPTKAALIPLPPAPDDTAEKARIARANAHAMADRAASTVAAQGYGDSGIFINAEAVLARAQAEYTAGQFTQARDDFDKASATYSGAARNILDQASTAEARDAQTKMRSGDLQGAQSVLYLAKKLKQAMATFPAAADRAPALADASTAFAQKANDAASAAYALKDRAISAITSLGLDPAAAFINTDPLLARAQSELSGGQHAAAAADFSQAASTIATDTLTYFDQQSAAYASLSQRKMRNGDFKGAQSALDLAKRIKASKTGFQ